MNDENSTKRRVNGEKVVLVLIVCAVLGYLSIRSAVQNTVMFEKPELGAKMWPADGASLVNSARRRVVDNEGSVDDVSRVLYENALVKAPASAGPIMLAGLRASERGDISTAFALMERARARDPRQEIVRFWLFDQYMRTGRYAQGLREATPAMRLRPETTTAVLTVLAAMTLAPEAVGPLTQAIAERPFWRTAFFNTAPNAVGPEPVLRVLQALPRNSDRTSALAEQRAVLLAMVNDGHVDKAYQAWVRFLPPTFRARTAVGQIYDGNFAGFPGAAPFNWILTSGGGSTAKYVPAGDLPEANALNVDYAGNTPALLAEQVVPVSFGGHRLSLKVRQRTQGAASNQFVMDVRCVSTNESLARLALANLSPQPELRSVDFTVPSACSALRIRLNGVPGEIFSETAIQMTAVKLTQI